MKTLFKRIIIVLFQRGNVDYNRWLTGHLPSQPELIYQRQKLFRYVPVFSIVIPIKDIPELAFKEMIESIIHQSYEAWEVCLIDGCSNSTLSDLIAMHWPDESRIKYNACIDMAGGDYLLFMGCGDMLTSNALYECADVLNRFQNIDIIYTDEDKFSQDHKQYFMPHFKSDFNLDLLRSFNYIGHLFVVRSSLIQKAGVFQNQFGEAQDYDYILRCIELADGIYHIPKILYHKRIHTLSAIDTVDTLMEIRALEAHYKRLHIRAEVSESDITGIYHTEYQINGEPLISIIIPNKDHIDDLEKCIRSIEEKSCYQNYEYIILENNSNDIETFEYYHKLEKENPKVKIEYWDEAFNYSLINNFGATKASGEFLLFMNNDIEMLVPECLNEMLGICQREEVGIVGAKLFYPDDTIQHAGVVIGYGGICGHTFIGLPKDERGYFARESCTGSYSAVSAACMMTRKDIFDMAGGFSPAYQIAFGDIDFCLKVRSLGKLVVYTPFARFYHYESKSRGIEDTPEKIKRFNDEVDLFRKNWIDIIEKGDPYYNPNLTLDKPDFSIRHQYLNLTGKSTLH